MGSEEQPGGLELFQEASSFKTEYVFWKKKQKELLNGLEHFLKARLLKNEHLYIYKKKVEKIIGLFWIFGKSLFVQKWIFCWNN